MPRGIVALFALLLIIGSSRALAESRIRGDGSGNDPQPQLARDDAPRLSRSERRQRIAALEKRYQDFLDLVRPIMTESELDLFLQLESDAQRDAFVEGFWLLRDSDPASSRNEFRESYVERFAEAVQRFRNVDSDQGRIYLIHGAPAVVTVIDTCRYLKQLEIWSYEGAARRLLIFYRDGAGPYRLWNPVTAAAGPAPLPMPGREGTRTASAILRALEQLLSPEGLSEGAEKVFYAHLVSLGIGAHREWPLVLLGCVHGELILEAIAWNETRGLSLEELLQPPPVDQERVRNFLRTTVVANPDAATFPVEADVDYGGVRGSRTITRIRLQIDREHLTPLLIDDQRFFNLDVIGETVKADRLFERFRYRFDFPADAVEGKLPLAVERHLREGKYRVLLKVIDANSSAEAVIELDLDVPAGSSSAEEASSDAATDPGDLFSSAASRPVVRIAPLPAEILTGHLRIEALVQGEGVTRVDFLLDGQKIMSRRSPPYTLELDLGSVPRSRRVRVLAYGADGDVLDGDEVVVNAGADPFRVRIVSPRFQKNLSGLVRVELELQIPDGKQLDRIELYRNDQKVGSMTAPPFVQSILFPSSELVYLRAVAFLQDGAASPAEDAVLLNADEYVEQVEVQLVELPTTVIRDGRVVQGLSREDFTVLEEGREVPIARFEYVRNLPLSVGIAIDSSGSMRPRIAQAQNAGQQFLRRVLDERDQAFIVAFDRQPYLAARWSSVLAELTAGLASVRAEESTALFDAVIYSLYQFEAIQGQKALILISDGEDTTSRFSFDQSVEYARRRGIPIYVIGIGLSPVRVDLRMKLDRFASETGGRAWYIDEIGSLDKIYSEIENELRSQYLIGFYRPDDVEPDGDFRNVTVEVPASEVRTIRGYYP